MKTRVVYDRGKFSVQYLHRGWFRDSWRYIPRADDPCENTHGTTRELAEGWAKAFADHGLVVAEYGK